MAGTESDLRRAADARLAEAKKAGSDDKTIARLKASRDVARDTKLSKTGGNRQAGER